MNNSKSTKVLKTAIQTSLKHDVQLQINEWKNQEIMKQQNPEVQTQLEVKTGKRLVQRMVIVIIVIIATLGIGIVLLVMHFQSDITQISRIQLNFDDQSNLQVVRTQIISKNVFSQNLYFLLDIVFFNNQQQRLNFGQKKQTQDYYISSYSPQNGITVRMSSDSNINIYMNMPVLINHFLQTNNQIQQLMDSTISQNQKLSFYVEILQTMNSAFSQVINSYNNGQIQFTNINMVDFKITSTSIQFDNNSLSFPFPSTQQSRQIFIDSIMIFFKTEASKLASSIDSVSKNASLIDKMAFKVINNDVISSITVGKLDNILNRYIHQMKFEQTTNNRAKFIAKACIPQAPFKMSCSLSSIIGNSIPFTVSTGISTSEKSFEQDKSILENFSMIFVDDSTKIIPAEALHNFIIWENMLL